MDLNRSSALPCSQPVHCSTKREPRLQTHRPLARQTRSKNPLRRREGLPSLMLETWVHDRLDFLLHGFGRHLFFFVLPLVLIHIVHFIYVLISALYFLPYVHSSPPSLNNSGMIFPKISIFSLRSTLPYPSVRVEDPVSYLLSMLRFTLWTPSSYFKSVQ